jgi:hypothetical protein
MGIYQTLCQQWYCTRCRQNKEAILEQGKPKVRSFRNGYIAVQLSCFHWVAVNRDRVN